MAIKFVEDQSYLEKLIRVLSRIEHEQLPNIRLAAKTAYESLKDGGVIHVFSTGHSHMIVEEMFYRTGGLVPVNPLLDNCFMLHEGALSATMNERTSGTGEQLLDRSDLRKGETIIISSNSGINNVPIEAALYAKKKGLHVVAITSVDSSKRLPSRHESGKKLYEFADIVIDNYAPEGDGLIEIPQNGQKTGGASTFCSLFIAQRIVLTIENLYIADGMIPPVFMSANLPDGDAFNEKLAIRYKDRIRSLFK